MFEQRIAEKFAIKFTQIFSRLAYSLGFKDRAIADIIYSGVLHADFSMLQFNVILQKGFNKAELVLQSTFAEGMSVSGVNGFDEN